MQESFTPDYRDIPGESSLMASQDDAGINFSYDHEQQNYRLLELPSALLELVASPNPHMYDLLHTAVHIH